MSESASKESTVHVFSGQFSSRAEACEYSESQWEPEPDESASDEEYDAWAERNPTWAMREDLDVYLDSDFIETIEGDNRYNYLEGMLEDEKGISNIREREQDGANILVLIFKEAVDGSSAQFKSTGKLTYCGEYGCCD